jgi:hypothetical protein
MQAITKPDRASRKVTESRIVVKDGICKRGKVGDGGWSSVDSIGWGKIEEVFVRL